MSWKSVKLGEICTLNYGKSLQNYSDHLAEEGSARVFGTNGPIGWTKEALTKEPTIIVGRKGAYRGVHISSGPSWTIDTAYFTSTDPSVVDLRWFFYRLRLLDINSMNSGAAIPSTKREDFYAASIRLPDLLTQQRIAGILSAYDDLIENNHRRIGLLEQAARLLYREWFVHLRFPGHETAKIVDGLPEGWKRATLGQLADEVDYGFTASASPEADGPRFLRITDIVSGAINWHEVPRCEIPEARLKKFLLKKGDVVVARTGATTGWARRIGELAEHAVFASYLVRFRFGQKMDPVLAATFMESDLYKTTIQGRLGGAAQPNASAKVLAGVELAVPPRNLQSKFKEQIAENNTLVDLLVKENAKLTRARDLLLPRLMDGRIPV